MKPKLNSVLMLGLSLTLLAPSPARSFEIDSFYKRTKSVKDSMGLHDDEVNKRLTKAISLTNSCDIKELYTNVRNQLNADSSGMGVIGGIEKWSESNAAVDRIEAPPADQAIYTGTSFESFTSMGFWLSLYGTVKENVSGGILKAKLAVRKLLSGSSDPLELCKVADADKELAQKFIERAQRKGPPGGPPPGGPGGGFPGEGSDRPPRPPEDGEGPPGGGPGGEGDPPGESDSARAFASSESATCIKSVLGIKGTEKNGSLQPVVNVHGSRIGADKFGHFFDQGFDYFQKQYAIQDNKVVENNDGLNAALDYGTKTEEGMYGLKATGVKSYGDLAANYDGSRFWYNLANGSAPIVSCQNGRFVSQKKFTFADYVTDAWDEGINCSEYKSDEMKANVAKNLKALNLSCPIEAAKCQKLSSKYKAEVLKKIIGPDCMKEMTASNSSSENESRRGVK